MVFLVFISFFILLRIAELLYSRHNQKWLLRHHAVEYGKEHYPFMVAMHIGFILSLIVENVFQEKPFYSLPLIGACLFLLIFKCWTVYSLGKFWNTRIYRVPGYALMVRGPYRYFKHPNYMIVTGELLFVPLAFGLNYTALIFFMLNGAMLYVRIQAENKALRGTKIRIQ
ncbi:MAG: isoprenylcysteine carboxyl methyltransferase family protein [Bacteroidia bacterium]